MKYVVRSDGDVLGEFGAILGLSGDTRLSSDNGDVSLLRFRHPRTSKRPDVVSLSTPHELKIELVSSERGPIATWELEQATCIHVVMEERRPIELWWIGDFWCQHPLESKILEGWATKWPMERGSWVGLSIAEKQGWLRASYTAGRLRESCTNNVNEFELMGEHVVDYPSLFIAFGEAIRGPAGYFGADLDSLEDCLLGGFGATPPFTLRWLKSDVSKANITRLGWLEANLANPTNHWSVEELSRALSTQEEPLWQSILHLLRERNVNVELL